MRCFVCDLPDLYDGAGDGIGSCECPRCEWCHGPPGVCNCESANDDYWDGYDEWADHWVWRPIETITPAGGVL